MMNCADFETLMADALGDELSSSDRPSFEAHLDECPKCRLEYETTRRTVETMRQLSGPAQATVRREGSRLVVEDRRSQALLGAQPHGVPRWLKLGASLRRGGLRYAASLLIAFTAGYVFHAGLIVADADRSSHLPDQPRRAGMPQALPGENLAGALAYAHSRNPARSDLAKCLVAIGHRTP